ncbi:LysM peptidoglycan-binding domain-containing protein [Reinekea blandensis]|uniref:Soluble lytic murein transglycosylase and related regulatory protein (Some contain LysM/invasin domains) n=1 Tax=Reinekea blandensis MED297 TaxID=314283 RepID=A4BHL5_9GAMM|nr:LysM peptidoglycan-binding domain-containing protein [Reinekea blandensis]EAR08413.1 Soluble lytic murein transglycosylase and related regulatory protein (some contain LysM/invasin domains) [Reinekea blandensis MED297]
MKIIQRFTPLTALCLLSACQLIPLQPSEQANSEAAQPSKTVAQQEQTSAPDLTTDPKNDALAQNLNLLRAQELYRNTIAAKQHWFQPLDLTRPDPYDKYPDDLYQVLRRNFTFDLTIEDRRVMQQLRWYASHQSYINRVSDRASRYLYHIVQELDARNMPMDLALLPIVESAFDPFAYSHGSASGMWQFIPSTGRMYGLKQNWWYDGRRDVLESTRAALDYLDQLNRMFDGDWLLALASYNSGPGTVLKAQRRNRAAGKPTDFWNLDLPTETEAYVPKMFALAKLFHSPDEYGIELPIVPNEPFFDVVRTGGQIDLAQAASLADMSLSDLYLLNPGFNRWATDPDGPHHLLVHVGKGELFEQRIAQLPVDQRLTWKRYAIEPGDSLLSIARRFEVTVDVVKDVNNIRGNLIRAGDTLLIPVASRSDNAYALSADNRLRVKQNALAGSDKNRVDYTVQSGDTFWDLSRKFNVSVQSLAKWNNMAPKDVLRPGQTLVIWSDEPVSVTTASLDNRSVVRKVGYVVREGDSLYRIANKFNLRISDIQKWNTLSQKYLQPGDRLTLYVDVTRMQ